MRSASQVRAAPPADMPTRKPARLGPAVALSDAELAERIASGDTWAEEALYRRLLPELHGVVQRLLASSGDADDVIQETFATAFEIWDQLREPARVRNWLMQIAIRKVHRRFRRRRLLRALGLDRSVDDATLELLASCDADADRRAELALLDRVLDRMPSADRIAWMLRHVEGMRLEEVAHECGCSLATAKRRIAAAGVLISAHVSLGGKDA